MNEQRADRLEYEGIVYVRPVGRGVILEDSGTDLVVAIEDLVDADISGGWRGRLRIVVEPAAEGGDELSEAAE